MKNFTYLRFPILLVFLFLYFISIAAPPNDECINAIELPVATTCNFVQYSNEGATASAGIPQPICGNYQGGDVWFKLVVPATGGIQLNANVGSMTDGVMALYLGDCTTMAVLACDDDGSPNGLMPLLEYYGLTPGSTVYIRFWGYGNNNFGTFAICAKAMNPPNNCALNNAGGCSCPTPGATDCQLLPDIIAGKHSLNDTNGWYEFSQLAANPDKGLLRLDVATANVGWGPMEVIPTNDYLCGTDTLHNFFPPSNFVCPNGAQIRRLINQKVYHKAGNSFQFELRPAGFMIYHPTHGHIHMDDWGLYTLRLRDASVADTLQWPIVNSGIKVSFCLLDLTTCSATGGDCIDAGGNVLTNSDFPNYGLGGGNYNCGNDMQGISVGKVDIYHSYLDESFVKIPYEACNGEYHVVIQIDPDNHFLEMNENNNWLSAKTNLTQQRQSNTGPYAYLFSEGGNILCNGNTMQLKASGANSFTWSTGETTQNIIINQPGKYWVRATTPCGTATSDTLEMVSNSAIPAQYKADTVCTGTQAHLFANGNNTKWYDAVTGGNLVFTGNNFTTPALTGSTTYYVANEPLPVVGSFGPAETTFSGNGYFSSSVDDYLIFNAFLPFTLKNVTVNAQNAGNLNVQLRTIYGKLISEKTVAVQVGVQEILLNMYIPAGLNLQLGIANSSVKLYCSTVASGNIGYPYKFNSIANIVGSADGDIQYSMYYNWKIEVPMATCGSVTRLAITAMVVPPDAPVITGLAPTYLHTASPVTLSAMPAGGVFSGTAVSGITFSPAVAGIGTHDITYTYTLGNCTKSTIASTTIKFDSATIHYNTEIKIINNPASNPQILITVNETGKAEWRMFNEAGQLIQKGNYTLLRGNNLITPEMQKLSHGIYLFEIKLSADNAKKIFKILR